MVDESATAPERPATAARLRDAELAAPSVRSWTSLASAGLSPAGVIGAR
jgi:hypothetical protein